MGSDGVLEDRRRRPPTLSAQLRDQTRAAHVAVEVAFALDRWLADRCSYRDLLVALRAFYAPVEDALGALAGWDGLKPEVDVDRRRRTMRLDEDLAQLGMALPTGGAAGAPTVAAVPAAGPTLAPAPAAGPTVAAVPAAGHTVAPVPAAGVPAAGTAAAGEPVPRVPVLGSLAEGVGCLYVLEGSALGGRIVARRARTALGAALPVAFFSSPGRDLTAEWRSLQAAFDAFGGSHGSTARRVAVATALRTFAALGDWLDVQTLTP